MWVPDVYNRFMLRDAAIGLYCLWWGVGAIEATEIRLNPPYVLVWRVSKRSHSNMLLGLYDLLLGDR